MSLNPPSPAPPSRRAVPLALFAVILLVVAGAAIAATAAYFELKPSAAPPGSLSVTDDYGRTVSVPSNPTRVVVLAPSITDSMVLLGLRDRIVGVDCGLAIDGGLATDYNSSQVAQWSLNSSMCIETYPVVNVDQILNATPQLVLTSTITSVSDVEELSTVYHLPVVLLQPSTIGGILVDVSLLGTIFGVQGAASSLNGQLQVVLGGAQNASTNFSSTFAPYPTVLLTYYADPASGQSPGYWTYGPGTFGQSLLELMAATSISANATLPYPELSGSQVLYANPGVVIYGTGFGVTLSTYQQGPDWSSLGAVGANAVYGVDSNFITEPDPTMVLQGVPILLNILHPGLYHPA